MEMKLLSYIQLNPAITDLKGPTNFMRYCRIALLPKRLSFTIFFAIFFGNHLTFKNEKKKPFAFQSNENARILLTTNADRWAGALNSPFPFPQHISFQMCISTLVNSSFKMDHKWDEQTNEVLESRRQFKSLIHN